MARKKLSDDKSNLKGQIASLSKRVKKAKDNLRAGIARDLSSNFKNANIDAVVDPKTGSVTLLMDRNLLFETNSSRLSKFAKSKLNQLIPLYAKVLFGDDKVREKINTFNIEGHASPNYKNYYVDPMDSPPEAFNYNLNLSSRRALSIANYIYGNKVEQFPYKHFMRSKTRPIGMGFTRPVLRPHAERIVDEVMNFALSKSPQKRRKNLVVRAPASKRRFIAGKIDCGKYSCSLSQRVELSFTLKDDPSIIDKIINNK